MTQNVLKKTLLDFTQRYGFNIPDENWEMLVEEGEPYEIEFSLFSIFDNIGSACDPETGFGPSEYLPELIQDSLRLVSADDWRIDGVESRDSWSSATINLQNSQGSDYQIVIKGVEDSDWVPPSFYDGFNKFAETHCEKSLCAIYGEDAYRLIVMPHVAVKELQMIYRADIELY